MNQTVRSYDWERGIFRVQGHAAYDPVIEKPIKEVEYEELKAEKKLLEMRLEEYGRLVWEASRRLKQHRKFYDEKVEEVEKLEVRQSQIANQLYALNLYMAGKPKWTVPTARTQPATD